MSDDQSPDSTFEDGTLDDPDVADIDAADIDASEAGVTSVPSTSTQLKMLGALLAGMLVLSVSATLGVSYMTGPSQARVVTAGPQFELSEQLRGSSDEQIGDWVVTTIQPRTITRAERLTLRPSTLAPGEQLITSPQTDIVDARVSSLLAMEHARRNAFLFADGNGTFAPSSGTLQIVSIDERSAAARAGLRTGQLIVTVNGTEPDPAAGAEGHIPSVVKTATSVTTVSSDARWVSPAGSPVTLGVVDQVGDEPRPVTVAARGNLGLRTAWLTEDDRFPALSQVTGGSGGLIMALAAIDASDPQVDLSAGVRTSGSGALRQDGTVQPVNGVRAKIDGVGQHGPERFFAPAGSVPASYIQQAADRGVEVLAVRTLSDALEMLCADAPTHRACR